MVELYHMHIEHMVDSIYTHDVPSEAKLGLHSSREGKLQLTC